MSYRKNDEWGLIIQKQMEMAEIQQNIEKQRYKAQQDAYKKELDNLLKVKAQQKDRQRENKFKESQDIYTQLKFQEEIEKSRKAQVFESQRKIVEENAKLIQISSQVKETNKLNSITEEQKNIEREKERNAESLAIKQIHKKAVENAMSNQMKAFQEKKEQEKIVAVAEKEREMIMALEEEQRMVKRDMNYITDLSKRQQILSKKEEAFSKNIGPKMIEKELNYVSWVEHAAEVKKQEEFQRRLDIERKRDQETKHVNEILRRQAEEREMQKFISREKSRAEDEELQKRIEYSMRAEQERFLKKKYDVLSYREELLNQAALDKEKRQSEYRLSDKEKMINKSILENDKSSLQKGAERMLKSVEVSKNLLKPSGEYSPSLRNTTLQMDYAMPVGKELGDVRMNKRHSIF